MASTPTRTGTEQLLYEVDAARLMNLSSRTLQAWRSKGLGPPYVRVGRAIRYRWDDIAAWLDSRTVKCRPQRGIASPSNELRPPSRRCADRNNGGLSAEANHVADSN